jgi:hypothetical protein
LIDKSRTIYQLDDTVGDRVRYSINGNLQAQSDCPSVAARINDSRANGRNDRAVRRGCWRCCWSRRRSPSWRR